MKKHILPILLTFVILFSLVPAGTADAVSNCNLYSGTNIGKQTYTTYTDTIKSYLVPLDDGGFMRVQADAVDKTIVAEYYDKNFTYLKTVDVEYGDPSLFGGFYAASDAYYLVTGNDNKSESNSTEVFRITKYDKNWNELGHDSLFGANTQIPFIAGTVRFAQDGKWLFIRTCHQMYMSSDGLNHQANVTIQLNTDTMKITDSLFTIRNAKEGYMSHSFNQFIDIDNGKIVAIDHGDAFPRYIGIFKYSSDYTTGSFYSKTSTLCTEVPIFDFSEHGTLGNNNTGASVGGFAITSDTYFIVGNSILYNNLDTDVTRNIFVSTIDKNLSGTAKVTYITHLKEGEGTCSTPHLVKITASQYLVMWTQDGFTYGQILNGKGEPSGDILSIGAAPLSDCVPFYLDGTVYWYSWKEGKTTFYTYNVLNAKLSQRTVTSGHDYEIISAATKTNKNATIKCKNCGKEETLTVVNNAKIWWNVGSLKGTFTGKLSGEMDGNSILGMKITNSGTFDNYDMVIESSIEGGLEYEISPTSKKLYSITFLRNGTHVLSVYPKYAPSICAKFTITVTGLPEIGEETDEPDNPLGKIISGDLDGDGEITAGDLTTLARVVAKIETFTDARSAQCADINKDGTVDATDLTILSRYIAKIISTLD